MTPERQVSTDAVSLSSGRPAPLRRHSRKAALMIGAASFALTAGLSAGDAQAQDKWDAWIAAGGLFGSEQQGEVDIFVPLFQGSNSMLFFNAQGLLNSNDEQQGSLGIGFRTMVNANWILGFNGFFDYKDTQYDNTFMQGGVGIEALSENWDFRVNGHFPESDSKQVPELGFDLFLRDNDIGILSYNERALAGVDGEVGYKLPLFDSDPDFEIRIFAGGFYYPNSNAGGQDIAGPKGRIEARIYDIDFLTNGSRLVLGGEVRDDDVRGTEGFGSVLVRMPLSIFSGGAPKLTGLDRRMVDRIERDMVTTGIGYQTEDVFVNNGDVGVGTIFFTEDMGGGSGVAGDPTGLKDGITAAGINSIVVLDGTNGAYVDDGTGVVLNNGQNLIGGDKTVLLTGVETYSSLLFNPADATGLPLINGAITGIDENVNLITFTNNSTIGALTLDGNFYHGIFGPDVGSNFTIMDNSIDLAGALGNGIDVTVNNPQNFIRPVVVGGSGTVPSGVVMGNTVGSSGGTGQEDGIHVRLFGDDGLTKDWNLWVTENNVTDVDDDGIVVFHQFTNGTTFTSNTTVSDNSVFDVGDDGVQVGTEAFDAGTSVKQSLDINDNIAVAIGDDAIFNFNIALGGAILDQADPININGNSIVEAGDDGIDVLNIAAGGGTLLQTVNAIGNYIDPPPVEEVEELLQAVEEFFLEGDLPMLPGEPDPTMTQTLSLLGGEGEGPYDIEDIFDHLDPGDIDPENLPDGSHLPDLPSEEEFNAKVAEIEAWVDNSLPFGQEMDGLVMDGGGGEPDLDFLGSNGIQITNLAAGGTLDQDNTFNILDNTIVSIANDGIAILNAAAFGGIANQSFNIGSNSIVDIGDDAIQMINVALGPTTTMTQSIDIYDNTIGLVGDDGINVLNLSLLGATLDQGGYSIHIDGNLLETIGDDGIQVVSIAALGGDIKQSLAVTDNALSFIGDDGILNLNWALLGGSEIDQADPVDIDRNTLLEIDDDGITVVNVAAGDATITQKTSVSDNSVLAIGDTGIFVGSGAFFGGQIAQPGAYGEAGIFVAGNTVRDVLDDGIENHALALGPGATVKQSVDIYNNDVIVFDDDGIVNSGIGLFGGTVDQADPVTIRGNRVFGTPGALAGDDGIQIIGIAAGGDPGTTGTVAQTVSVSGNEIMYVGDEGVSSVNLAFSYGELQQANTITIFGNSISDTGNNGVLAVNAAIGGGQIDQTMHIDANTIVGTGLDLGAFEEGDGVGVLNVAAGDDSAGTISTLTQSLSVGQFAGPFSFGNSIDMTADDGIDVVNLALFDGVIDQGGNTVNINANNITNVGGDGIALTNLAGNEDAGAIVADIDDIVDLGLNVTGIPLIGDSTGTITQTAHIDGNTISGTDDDGIDVFTQAAGVGSTITQTLTVGQEPVYSFPFGDSSRGNVISDIGNDPDDDQDGISVANTAFLGGVLEQADTITIGYNTILGGPGALLPDDAIDLDNQALEGGTINQTATIGNNTVGYASDDGIETSNLTTNFLPTAGGGLLPNGVAASLLDQTLNVVDNSSTYNGNDGLSLVNTNFSFVSNDIPVVGAVGGFYGRLIQEVHVDRNFSYSNGDDGLGITNNAQSVGLILVSLNSNAYLEQIGTVNDNTLNGNGNDGIDLNNNTNLSGIAISSDNYAMLRQRLSLDPNTITGNDGDGIDMDNEAAGHSIQNLYLEMSGGNLVNGNDGDGLDIFSESDDDAFMNMVFRITESDFNYNTDGDGIHIRSEMNDDSSIFTDIHIIGVSASGNDDDGIELYNDDDGSGMTTMTAHLRDTTVTGNSDIGVFVYNDGSDATQDVSFGQGGNVVTGNTTYDIYVYNDGGTQTVNFTGVTYNTCTIDTDGGTQTIIPPGACP